MRKRPTKPRNRARIARDHFKFSVQWLIAFENKDHPVCCAAFTTLSDAEWFMRWIAGRPNYYGVEIVEL